MDNILILLGYFLLFAAALGVAELGVRAYAKIMGVSWMK